jgi:hypothetical protein
MQVLEEKYFFVSNLRGLNDCSAAYYNVAVVKNNGLPGRNCALCVVEFYVKAIAVGLKNGGAFRLVRVTNFCAYAKRAVYFFKRN